MWVCINSKNCVVENFWNNNNKKNILLSEFYAQLIIGLVIWHVKVLSSSQILTLKLVFSYTHMNLIRSEPNWTKYESYGLRACSHCLIRLSMGSIFAHLELAKRHLGFNPISLSLVCNEARSFIVGPNLFRVMSISIQNYLFLCIIESTMNIGYLMGRGPNRHSESVIGPI